MHALYITQHINMLYISLANAQLIWCPMEVDLISGTTPLLFKNKILQLSGQQ